MKGRKSGHIQSLFHNEIIKYLSKYRLSLLIVLMGIFLFPQFARLATITPPAVIDLTNDKRQEHGLSPLQADQYLAKAARLKAKTILEEQTFKHELNNKKFFYWIDQTPYQYEYAGENLAIDFQRTENIVQAWMDSAPHRKNILNSHYKDIGIAVVEGEFNGHKSTVVVQMLGRSRPGSDLSEQIPKKEKISLQNKNKTLSSTTLGAAFSVNSPSQNIFLIQNFYSRIFPSSFFTENKFSIAALSLASIFFYFYLYFLLSALRSIRTKNNEQ